MSSISNYDKFINEEIYNWVCEIGSDTALTRTDKTTINNLLEIFKGDPIDACQELMLYIIRQSGRGEIDRSVARRLVGHIYQIYNNFRNDNKKLEEAIRKYIILFKWVFESSSELKISGQNFQQYVQNFMGNKR